MYVCGVTAALPKLTVWFATTRMTTDCVAVSPSESVAVYVYAAAAVTTLGVPETRRVAASNVSPAGRSAPPGSSSV